MNTITSQTHINDPQNPSVDQIRKPSKRDMVLILGGCAMMFLVLHLGLTWTYGKMDETLSRIGVTAVMLVLAVIFQRSLFIVGTKKAFLMLGYGRAYPKAILVAGIISVVLLAFFPIFTAITGAPITLKSNWLWLLIGIIAVPEPYYMTAVAAWIAIQIVTPFLVYAFLGNLLKESN